MKKSEKDNQLKILLAQKPTKFYNKANKNLQEILNKSLDEIEKNPFSYELLRGDLQGFYAYHFRFNYTQFRIAYTVLDNEINIVLIGTRENFYSELKRMVD